MSAPMTYFRPRSFIARGFGPLAVTRAPDGLPLLVMVPRPPSMQHLLEPLARDLGVQLGAQGFGESPLAALAEQAEALRASQRVRTLDIQGEACEVMILGISARQISGQTLLERLLGATSPTMRPDEGQPSQSLDDRAEHTGLAALSQLDAQELLQARAAYQAGQVYVGLTMADSRPVLVRLERDAWGWPHYSYRAPFQPEATAQLDGSWFEGQPYTAYATPQEPERIAPSQEQAYRERRMQSGSSMRWQWHVPRQAIARAIYDLVGVLAARHDRGQIHGDLKPSNVLLTAQGPRAIDGLSLSAGARSPAITRGWAAPEQIMAKPVSVQTDHYPVALMLLRLVEGVLYGVEARVTIPIGGTALAQHTLLHNPGVYIDPSTAPIVEGHLEGWRAVLERCVRFEPEQRFSSTEALLDAMRPLIEHTTLRGELRCELQFGQAIIGASTDSSPTTCWLST